MSDERGSCRSASRVSAGQSAPMCSSIDRVVSLRTLPPAAPGSSKWRRTNASSEKPAAARSAA